MNAIFIEILAIMTTYFFILKEAFILRKSQWNKQYYLKLREEKERYHFNKIYKRVYLIFVI